MSQVAAPSNPLSKDAENGSRAEVVKSNTDLLLKTDIPKIIIRNNFVSLASSPDLYEQGIVLWVDRATGKIIDIGAKVFSEDDDSKANTYLNVNSSFKEHKIKSLSVNGATSLSQEGQDVIAETVSTYNTQIS